MISDHSSHKKLSRQLIQMCIGFDHPKGNPYSPTGMHVVFKCLFVSDFRKVHVQMYWIERASIVSELCYGKKPIVRSNRLNNTFT